MSTPAGPPLPEDEVHRLEAVHRYNVLDTPPDAAFDRIAALAARFFATGYASVTLVDEDRIWFKATYGLPDIEQIDRHPGLCASAILEPEPYVVTDALTDLRTDKNALVHSEMGVRFYAAAPITTTDGYRLGTVNVLGVEPRQATAEEMTTLQDLAAIAMDELELRLSTMDTTEEEREARERKESLIATLQQTLLPPQLPTVPGLDVAAYYHTAVAEEVGGDFYDVFKTGDGRFAFFLGDVCGKGVPAAALTSLARYTLRAGGLRQASPAQALSDLNSAILMESHIHDGRYCTAVYGQVEAAGADGSVAVTLARGGHPPVMLVRADGTVEQLAPYGTLVGALPGAEFECVSFRMSPGDALVLYTDGLTEARISPLDRYGEDRLASHLSLTGGQPAPVVVAVLRELLDGFDPPPEDDVALLALSIPTTRKRIRKRNGWR